MIELPDDARSDRLLKQVRTLWTRFSNEIESEFGLTAAKAPESVVLTPKSGSEVSSCCRLENGKLHLCEDLEVPFTLEILVAKTCFSTSLPHKLLCKECIDDLSMEFARQKLSEEARNEFVEKWGQYSPQITISLVQVHNPSLTYPVLHRLVGSEGLTELVKELTPKTRYGFSLDLEGYISFLKSRIRRFAVILDHTELKIIKNLLKGKTNLTELAETIGITHAWISRKMSMMRQRSVLRRFDRTPFSRVGIRMFYFLLGGSGEDPFRFLKDCPFLYVYQKILTGNWDALATICVPDNIHSIRSIRDFIQVLSKWEVESWWTEIASSGVVNSFDYYDIQKGGWNIPWEALALQFRKIHGDRLAHAFPRVDKPPSRTKLELDWLDIRILDEVRQGKSSVSKVRNALRVGQDKVARRLKRLRDEELIVTTWEVHHVGLDEYMFISTDSKEVGESIAGWAQTLPRSIISFDVDRRLSMTSQLPTGGSYGMANALETQSHSISIGLLGMRHYGGWGLPIGLWDSDSQRWMFPAKEVQDWFESLR